MTSDPIPSEFAAFVRDVARRAFDTLADRVTDLEKPLRSVVQSWNKLSSSAKDKLLDQLIGVARGEDVAPSDKPKKRAVKRYKPEEVEKTLPAKPKKKAAPKKRKKRP